MLADQQQSWRHYEVCGPYVFTLGSHFAIGHLCLNGKVCSQEWKLKKTCVVMRLDNVLKL